MKELYSDKQVIVTSEYILIRKYYFPLATSKTILLSQISQVTMQDTNKSEPTWGICRSHLNNWFPYDPFRNIKTKFLEITMKGRRVRPAITPDDPDKVYRILMELFAKMGKSDEAEAKKEGEMGEMGKMGEEKVVESELEDVEVK